MHDRRVVVRLIAGGREWIELCRGCGPLSDGHVPAGLMRRDGECEVCHAQGHVEVYRPAWCFQEVRP